MRTNWFCFKKFDFLHKNQHMLTKFFVKTFVEKKGEIIIIHLSHNTIMWIPATIHIK